MTPLEEHEVFLDCPNADLTVCVFAGTNPKSIENLLTDLDVTKDPLQLGEASMKVHSGFLGNWRDAQPYVEEACHDVLEQDVRSARARRTGCTACRPSACSTPATTPWNAT